MGRLARYVCYSVGLACVLMLPAAAATAQDQPISAEAPPTTPPTIRPPLVSLTDFQNEIDAALQPATQPATPPAENALDAAAVSAGQSAFASACTTCHDAERSLSKRKTFAGWLATVRRMTGKDGAEIRSADVVPIATYLASVAGAAGGAAGIAGDGSTDDGSGWSFGTTISTLHRSASDEYPVEFPGFFAD